MKLMSAKKLPKKLDDFFCDQCDDEAVGKMAVASDEVFLEMLGSDSDAAHTYAMRCTESLLRPTIEKLYAER